MRNATWKFPRIVTCGLTCVLGMSMACAPITYTAYAADSLETLEERAISAAETYQQAQDQLDALNKQIDTNEQKIADLEAQMPELEAKCSVALVANYKLSQGRQELLDLLLSSDNFEQFITTLAYLNDATESTLDDMEKLSEAKSQLESTQAQLKQQQSEVETKAEEAQKALTDAQTAAQVARDEATRTAAEAQAAYESGKLEDSATEKANAAASAAAQTQAAESQTAQSQTTTSADTSKQTESTTSSSTSSGWKTVGASTYGIGDGLMYGTTASGATVTPTSMGVAMKTMPLGTVIEISYGGKTCYATVNDRGPFVAGREIDLQPAVAAALGFSGTGSVSYRVVG